MGFGMPWRRGPSKTTVLAGLQGIASIRDNLRWAEVFSRQGVAFLRLDQPGYLFGEKGLSEEGKRIMEAAEKANLLLIVKGLDSAQAQVLLENAKKPVILQTDTLPAKEILDLVKKTESAIGLLLRKGENAASYVGKIEEAKKVVGTDYISIVTESDLWENPGKGQMLDVIAGLLQAKYENEDLANLFSGAFMRALNRTRTEVP
jgi:microsomal dipeptidase-like Zn-dependent dipeptidase